MAEDGTPSSFTDRRSYLASLTTLALGGLAAQRGVTGDSDSIEQGDTVELLTATLAYQQPDPNAEFVTILGAGTIGEVVGGPHPVSGAQWWQLDLDGREQALWVDGQVLAVADGADPAEEQYEMEDDVVVATPATAYWSPGFDEITHLDAGTRGVVYSGPERADGENWWWLELPDQEDWGWIRASALERLEPGNGGQIAEGDEIELAVTTPVYNEPNRAALTTLPVGESGTVATGPVDTHGEQWWAIHFEQAEVTAWTRAVYLTVSDDDDDGGEEPTDPTVGMRGTFHRPPTDLDEMKAAIDEYADYGVTDLALEVFFHGETIYPSAYCTSQGYPAGFLAETIAYAHERGIDVHAWVQVLYLWNVAHLGDVPSGHLLDGDHEICVDGECATVNADLLTRRQDGRYHAEDGKLFVSPFADEVVETVAKIATEIEREFDVDGVMLDYVRYPKSEEPFGYGAADPEGVTHAQKEAAITDVVSQVAGTVSSVPTSACVFASYYTSDLDSEYHKAQRWEDWHQDASLDFIAPMCYSFDAYDTELAFSADVHSASTSIAPILAITEGHTGIDETYESWSAHDFDGYMLWRGSEIDRELP